ncbi:hypothetical protein [Shewanella sp. GD03713]|uniref:hypothetical protein n=1 Tax=Shewanella TaxID=22 RepID=UPI00244D5DC0|nr:hypothetical protein [Shewanella sp. GD03713]MDH1472649.1 hypothetical protein [Shewanella sp. GD03713]
MNHHITREIFCLKTQEITISYSDLQAYAIENNIRSSRQWFRHHNERKGGVPTPTNMPKNPATYFQKNGEWNGWAEFLGTNNKVTCYDLKSFLTSDLLKNDKAKSLHQFASRTMDSFITAFIPDNTEYLMYPKITGSIQLKRGGQ